MQTFNRMLLIYSDKYTNYAYTVFYASVYYVWLMHASPQVLVLINVQELSRIL